MKMDEEKLINLIVEFPELYDLEDPSYMNSSLKNNLWKDVAKRMGASERACKEKWRSLRDSYHRNLKRRASKTKNDATTIKKWKYESQMEFLRPHFKQKTNKDLFEDSQSTVFDNNTTVSSIYAESERSPQPSSERWLQFENVTAEKNKGKKSESVAKTLPKYLDSRATVTHTTETVCSIESFFKAMSASVLTLPADLQLEAKDEVFKAVSRLEKKNLLRKLTVENQVIAESVVKW